MTPETATALDNLNRLKQAAAIARDNRQRADIAYTAANACPHATAAARNSARQAYVEAAAAYSAAIQALREARWAIDTDKQSALRKRNANRKARIAEKQTSGGL